MSDQTNPSSTPDSADLERHRRGTRLRMALGTLIVLGALAAGYATAGSGASRQASHASLVAATTVTTTTVAPTTSTTLPPLPNCGSTRDPFDPSNAAPPNGSPAIC